MDLEFALDILRNVPPVDWEQHWDAIQEVQWWLDELKQDLQGGTGPERLYPNSCDIPSEELAAKINEFCTELVAREYEVLRRDLAAANEIWPHIRNALRHKKRGVPIGDPKISPDGFVGLSLKGGCVSSVKRKSEAIQLAMNEGTAGWYSVADFVLWLAGAGPIVEDTIKACGYAPLKK